jgi:hypothetical protein
LFDCDVHIRPIRADLVMAVQPSAGRHVRVAILAAFVSLVICSPAAGAPPEPGGRYSGALEWRGTPCAACVRLAVANDAMEFAGESRVGLLEHPKNRGCEVDTPLTALDDGASVRIDAAGYFRYTERERGHFVRVVGRFGDGGRRVSGTYVVLERRFGCRLRTRARFRADLVARPRAPTPGRFARCDPIFRSGPDSQNIGDSPARIFERDIGCTTVRDAVRHRFNDPQCRGLALGATCAAGRLFCTAIERGDREPAAQTRCSRLDGTAATAEVVAWDACRAPLSVSTLAANVPCPEARRLVGRWLRDDNCSDACQLESYTCGDTVWGDSSGTSRCRDRIDPRRIIDITLHPR